MPIKIDNREFEDFQSAVEHVRRTRPKIENPEAYVGAIEKIHKAKLKLAGIRSEANDYEVESMMNRVKSPLSDKVPYGKENRTPKKIRDDSLDRAVDEGLAISSGTKLRPKKPTQADRRRIISAKQRISELQEKIDEQRIAKEHNHSIVFRGYKNDSFKKASLETQSGKYAKYWLLNAKQTNGNGWGIAAHTAKENMKKFIGRPLVVTAQSWHGQSEYGDSFEHPYLPTNDMNKIFAHQEKFRVGSIVDVSEDKNGDWYATIEMLPKFASKNLPPFCSPAIYQLDASEHEGNISKWEALHLAALNENPAYGARIALLKGTCIGTKNSCSIQFKGAQLNAGLNKKYIPDLSKPKEEDDEDRYDEIKENRERRFKIEVDRHIMRGQIVCPKKLRERLSKLKMGSIFDEIEANPGMKIKDTKQVFDDSGSTEEEVRLTHGEKTLKKKRLELKKRVASLGEQNMTYQKSKHMKILKKKNPEVRKAQNDVESKLRSLGSSVDASHASSTWLSTKGDFIGGSEPHFQQIQEPQNKRHMYFPENGDEIITEFSRKNNLPRVQTFKMNRAGEKKISVGIHSPINKNQLKSIQELERGGNVIGFAVGPNHKTAVTGEGFSNLVKTLRENKFL